MQKLARIIHYFNSGIWETRLQGLSSSRVFFIRCTRTVMLAVHGFIKNDCIKTATVLTYYSLLNIVPLMAVLFAIAKGFGLKKIVESQIIQLADKANLQQEVANQIVTFSNSLLTHAKGGVIAGVGIALLLWTVISILGKIEDSFNTVWEVKHSRTLIRKFSDYIAILVVAPILFAVSTSATVLISSKLKLIMDEISLLGAFGGVIVFLLNLLPYVFVWLLLIVLYVVMPNTRVPLRSGVLAGVVAGTCFQIVQFIYIKFQIGVAGYNAIYGSFAALPLFLVWLQTSWMIVLFGSEMAHANDHFETFGFHPDYSRISGSARRLLMIRAFHLIVKRFRLGEKPFNARQIAFELEIPVRLIQQFLAELTAVGLVIEVNGESHEGVAFQPARSIEDITIKSIFDACEQHGEIPSWGQPEEADEIAGYLKKISDAIAASPGNVKLKDI